MRIVLRAAKCCCDLGLNASDLQNVVPAGQFGKATDKTRKAVSPLDIQEGVQDLNKILLPGADRATIEQREQTVDQRVDVGLFEAPAVDIGESQLGDKFVKERPARRPWRPVLACGGSPSSDKVIMPRWLRSNGKGATTGQLVQFRQPHELGHPQILAGPECAEKHLPLLSGDMDGFVIHREQVLVVRIVDIFE